MRILRLLVVLLLPFLPGCLEMEQTIAITADGSGTHKVRMTIRETTLAEVERVGAAAGAMSEAARALFDKELVRRDLEAVGMTLAAHATEAKDRKRNVEVTAAFPTFAALQQSPLAGSRAEWTLAAGPNPGTVKLTLYPQGKAAWTEARAKAESMQTENDPIAEAFFRKKQAELTGLDLVVRFQVPGDVLVYTANMEKTGDREVTARIAADQIKTPQDLVRRLAPRFEVIFDGKDCKLPLQ
ncbi:MAG: hypothetical protein FJ306_00335 [Planctomycetes bacterium]|nr:hypothetical protein [Planctomycetota bacterium]